MTVASARVRCAIGCAAARNGRGSSIRNGTSALIVRAPDSFVQSIDTMLGIDTMNLTAIDLNLLVALDALISESHVGRAARRIGRSQPTTSHALKRLRSLFDDPLLVQVGSRMELTPRAAGLRESVADALRRVQTLLAVESFEPARSSRQFAAMMQDHIAHLLVPALIQRLHTEAPGIRLDVLPWQSPASATPAQLHSIDLLVSCTAMDIAGFEKEALFTDTEAVVVRTGYPRASRLKKLDAFLRARHVAVVGAGLSEDPVDSWLRGKGLSREIVLQVPSYLQALLATATGDVVAFVPRRLARAMARRFSLQVLPPPIEPGDYQEQLFYPRRAAQDPASMWLRTLARRIANDLDRADRA
jgi:DNA-binding transcriptional LysR family regulator